MWTSSEPALFVGRICSELSMTIEEWEWQIIIAEKILLQSHTPSFNTANLNKIGYREHDVRVLNWGKRRQLLPEVSISRWEGDFGIGNALKNTFVCQSKSSA
jgi:hypothetical protein